METGGATENCTPTTTVTGLRAAIKRSKAGEEMPRIITHAFVEVEVIDITNNGTVLVMTDVETRLRTPGIKLGFFTRLVDWVKSAIRKRKLRKQIP